MWVFGKFTSSRQIGGKIKSPPERTLVEINLAYTSDENVILLQFKVHLWNYIVTGATCGAGNAQSFRNTWFHSICGVRDVSHSLYQHYRICRHSECVYGLMTLIQLHIYYPHVNPETWSVKTWCKPRFWCDYPNLNPETWSVKTCCKPRFCCGFVLVSDEWTIPGPDEPDGLRSIARDLYWVYHGFVLVNTTQHNTIRTGYNVSQFTHAFEWLNSISTISVNSCYVQTWQLQNTTRYLIAKIEITRPLHFTTK